MYLFILFEAIGKSIPCSSILNIAIFNHFTASEKVALTLDPNILDLAPPPPPNFQNLPTPMVEFVTDMYNL